MWKKEYIHTKEYITQFQCVYHKTCATAEWLKMASTQPICDSANAKNSHTPHETNKQTNATKKQMQQANKRSWRSKMFLCTLALQEPCPWDIFSWPQKLGNLFPSIGKWVTLEPGEWATFVIDVSHDTMTYSYPWLTPSTLQLMMVLASLLLMN